MISSTSFSRSAASRSGGGVVRCLPGFALTVAEPTTVGLGDAFVGGFLAAVSQHGLQGRLRR